MTSHQQKKKRLLPFNAKDGESLRRRRAINLQRRENIKERKNTHQKGDRKKTEEGGGSNIKGWLHNKKRGTLGWTKNKKGKGELP